MPDIQVPRSSLAARMGIHFLPARIVLLAATVGLCLMLITSGEVNFIHVFTGSGSVPFHY
jgi:hypothetical protein